MRKRSTYVFLLGFQQNKITCNKIAISPFTSTRDNRIAENYLLHPRNQEHKTLIAEISIQMSKPSTNEPPSSIAHKRKDQEWLKGRKSRSVTPQW
jgi:hypothetical protein